MTHKIFTVLCAAALLGTAAQAQNFKLNELEYLEARGANVLVYSNKYAGIFAVTAGLKRNPSV